MLPAIPACEGEPFVLAKIQVWGVGWCNRARNEPVKDLCRHADEGSAWQLGMARAWCCGLCRSWAWNGSFFVVWANSTPNRPNHGGARAGGLHVGRCMCFVGAGAPSCGGPCCREDKAGCLARGEEEKSRREEALMQFTTLPWCVSAGGPSAPSPPLPAQAGGAELLGVKLSSGGSGVDPGLLLWLVPLAVPFLAWITTFQPAWGYWEKVFPRCYRQQHGAHHQRACQAASGHSLKGEVPSLKPCGTPLWGTAFPLASHQQWLCFMRLGGGAASLLQAAGFCPQNSFLVTRTAPVILGTWVNCNILVPLVFTCWC